jgi:hypothetical protein
MYELAAYCVVLSIAPKEQGQWALSGIEQSSNQQLTTQELVALCDPLPTTLQLHSSEISIQPSPLSQELSPGLSTVASTNSNVLCCQAIHHTLQMNPLTPSFLQLATSMPFETGSESGYDVNSAIQTDNSDDTLLHTLQIEEDQQPSDGNEGSHRGAEDADHEDQPMLNGDEGSDMGRAEDAGHEDQPLSDGNEGSDVVCAEDTSHEDQPPLDGNKGSNMEHAKDAGNVGEVNKAVGASKPATADHQDMPDEGLEEQASNDHGKKKMPAAKRIT